MPKLPVAIAGILMALLASVHGQPDVTRPEHLAGFWETTTGQAGFDGIFLGIDRGGTDAQASRHTMMVGVYRRVDGGEPAWAGYYAPGGGAEFNDNRLSVAGLTVTFDPDANRWAGSWLMNGERKPVVLERPHPAAGVEGHPLRGNWEGQPDSLPGTAPTTLHIVQASDGKVFAWMDRIFAYAGARNERFGERLTVISADPSNVILQTTNLTGAAYQFAAALSKDGNRLTGRWAEQSFSSSLNALHDFLRVP
jgi:hypothetical protein